MSIKSKLDLMVGVTCCLAFFALGCVPRIQWTVHKMNGGLKPPTISHVSRIMEMSTVTTNRQLISNWFRVYGIPDGTLISGRTNNVIRYEFGDGWEFRVTRNPPTASITVTSDPL